ncbi:GNAT family N-acetyltransferase [Paenibacillus xanthanilyticus]|uniref:GNAT family N-acetyltransferase n=2 Tax=Paenibacillus xanthanilyticus TaxID=1783531 RepID=A0ABV8KE10_9BACL
MDFGNKSFYIVAETERLVVRPLIKADYNNWLSECESRLPSQHQYDEGSSDMSERTVEWFSDFINYHQELAVNDKAYIFGVFRKEDGKHLGMIDFSTIERDVFQWGKIGYSIHNHHWNNGYGKEAVKEAIKVAFNELGFHRIEAHINVDNGPSIKLAESVGMEFECIRKGFIFEFGEWTDNLIYFKNST